MLFVYLFIYFFFIYLFTKDEDHQSPSRFVFFFSYCSSTFFDIDYFSFCSLFGTSLCSDGWICYKKAFTKVIYFFGKRSKSLLWKRIKGKLHSFWTQRTTEYIDEEFKMTENRKTSKVFVAVSQSTHSQVIMGESPLKGYVLASYAFWRPGNTWSMFEYRGPV